MSNTAKSNSVLVFQNDYQRIEELELSQIITGSYQRSICASRVNKIVGDFNPARLGVLVVNHRPDGDYAILDGQHRLSALRSMGVKRGLAIVLSGMTLEQEADFFRKQNENANNLSCFDLYTAGLVARDPHHMNIDEILERHSFHASRVSGPMLVTALSALSRIATQFGFSALDRVFASIAATWPTDPSAVRRDMLAGITEFVVHFGKTVPPEQFAARMKDKSPSDLLYEYRRRTEGRATMRNAFNPTMRFTLCAVLVEAYNKGLPAKSKARLKLTWYGPHMEHDEGMGWQ